MEYLGTSLSLEFNAEVYEHCTSIEIRTAWWDSIKEMEDAGKITNLKSLCTDEYGNKKKN